MERCCEELRIWEFLELNDWFCKERWWPQFLMNAWWRLLLKERSKIEWPWAGLAAKERQVVWRDCLKEIKTAKKTEERFCICCEWMIAWILKQTADSRLLNIHCLPSSRSMILTKRVFDSQKLLIQWSVVTGAGPSNRTSPTVGGHFGRRFSSDLRWNTMIWPNDSHQPRVKWKYDQVDDQDMTRTAAIYSNTSNWQTANRRGSRDIGALVGRVCRESETLRLEARLRGDEWTNWWP